MSVLKRAWANLCYRKLQTVGIIIIFTMLFGLSLVCLIVYHTADKSVEMSQKAIANAVTIQPPVVIGADGDAQNVTLSETDMGLMVKPDYVEEYNPIVQYPKFFTCDKGGNSLLSITAINNSAYYEPFSSGSFYLEEGKHFVSSDGAISEVLVSKPFAQKHGVKVGDTITLHESKVAKEFFMMDSVDKPYEVVVRGIFNSEDEKSIDNAKDWIYIPYESLVAYWKRAYNNQSRQQVHEIQRVIIYLKKSSDVDRYLEYIKKTINVEKIADMSQGIDYYNVNDVEAGTYNSTDPKQLSEMYSQTLLGKFFYKEWYYILIDRDWYMLVGTPMEGMRDVFRFIGIIIGGATFLIMVLLCSFTIRRRNKEFGILLSMGERKWKILLQIVAETVIMVSFAAIISSVVAPKLTNTYGNKALSQMSERSKLKQQEKKEKESYKQAVGKSMYAETYNMSENPAQNYTISDTGNVREKSHLDFVLSGKVILGYFECVFLLVVASMLLQLILLLRYSPARLVRR